MNYFLINSLLLLILCSISASINAQIYKWVDANGVQQFSNKPPPQGTFSEKIKIRNYRKNTEKKVGSKNNSKNIIMYSAEWCGVCKKAKRYFRRNNIAFKEYDIDKSFQAKLRFKKLGGKGVPLILIGDKKMKGFDEGYFKKNYGS